MSLALVAALLAGGELVKPLGGDGVVHVRVFSRRLWGWLVTILRIRHRSGNSQVSFVYGRALLTLAAEDDQCFAYVVVSDRCVLERWWCWATQ